MEKNPLEKLFEQVSEILEMTHKYKEGEGGKEKLDKSIDKEIDRLEENIELFRKVTDEAMKRAKVDEQVVQKAIKNPEKELSGTEQRLLLKAKKVRENLDELQKEYAKKARIINLQKKRAKSTGKKRQKKFKRLGGQGWTPL